ncbi:hypothetical protein GH714_001876 [Hevea brasiliensis]|uniref:Uncharacterized protein n=1 Tax=Hevea brasiliensis TaxID=3981 RepID=A0A6A6LQE6_HEVBR|nr:hypothetical protein GH714_001876 [Hevea brasiliensis]
MVAKLSSDESEPIELEATKSRMLEFEAVTSHMEDLIESLKSITDSHNSLIGIMDDIKDGVKEAVSTIQGELLDLKGKVNLLVRAASNPHMQAYEVGKAKIPKLKAFGNVHDAKEVDNFLFDMELYFNVTKNDSGEGRDMFKIDKVFNFLKGLKPWAKNKLMRRNMKELSVALSIAESLDDYSSSAPKRKFNSP